MKYFSWFILLLINNALLAQQPLYTNFQRFDIENGLPQNLVSGIIQDDGGFIWVSTMDGLARFDGKRFLVFRHQPEDRNSLASNLIQMIYRDSLNNIWLEYLGSAQDTYRASFQAFDPRTHRTNQNQSVLFPINYRALEMRYKRFGFRYQYHFLRHFFDERNEFKKKELVDTANVKLKSFLNEIHQGNEMFSAFSEDEEGRMWVATGAGLEVSDKHWRNFKRIEFPTNFQLSPERMGDTYLLHLPDHRHAIINRQLLIYNDQNGELKNITSDLVSNRNAGLITKDVQGRLVLSWGEYIFRLEQDDRLTLLWKYPGNQSFRAILVDRTNTLWVGTDSDGLYKINLMTPSFESHVYQDDFLTDVLVNEIGVKNTIAKDEIIRDEVYYASYTYADDQALYLSVIGGGGSKILRVENKNLTVIKTVSQGLIASSPDKKISFLDGKGFLYQWHKLNQPPATLKVALPLIDGYVLAIDFLADSSSYWVTTPYHGTFQFRENELLTTIKPYGDYQANVISNDLGESSTLWIGTISGGLYKWNKIEKKLEATYTTDNGLPNNTINSIVPDSLGYLWISTNKGITQFNPLQETFTNYSIADGLIESEFNRHHDLMLPSGRIAMGGTNGYSVFDPKEFKEDTYSPQVYITGFTINEKPIDHRRDSVILPLPINQLDEINLSYTNNSIGFEVAAIQFNAPEKIKYRYKLEGYDRNWVTTEGENKIRFSQLPFGAYTLLLNASNTAGIWSPAVRKLSIIIHPPFWLTWWAWLLYAVVASLVIRSYWRGYKKRLLIKQDAEFNIREAIRLREVDEIKTRFFSNITHEFRTPLTLILTPLEKYLQDETLPSRSHTLLNNNYRHATQLLELVNQLLDLAKIEAGQMPVNATAGELKLFAKQFAESFADMAAKKHIKLQCSVEGIDGHYLFDHEKWEKIIQNVLNNAVKFTPQGGSIHFSVTTKSNSADLIFIQVRDTGVGIRQELLSKIFERFYQADDSATRKHEGTGIGLSLVKELVELLNGTIEVESELNKGTLFSISLPAVKIKEIPIALETKTINEFHFGKDPLAAGIDHELPLILVVEDNDELRTFIRESLSSTWKVLEASNGLDGWKLIEAELPEIVVSDVMMPGMSGFELCSMTKKDPRTSHINFIMLTAKAAQESKIEGLESGADEYLTKPFHLYELELRIRNLLQEQHSLRKHLQEKLLPKELAVELPKVSDVFITKLQVYLDSNLDDTNLKVETVAEAMAMSKSTLNRKLNALLNISINDYIKQYRLMKAAVLLSEGYSVSEVSYRVGFESSSYFAMCFKEHFRQTPSAFVQSRE